MSVASQLRAVLITKRGKTVTEVAQELGMSRPAFSNVVNGNADLSVELAIKMEDVFGLNAKHLLITQLEEKINEHRRAEAR